MRKGCLLLAGITLVVTFVPITSAAAQRTSRIPSASRPARVSTKGFQESDTAGKRIIKAVAASLPLAPDTAKVLANVRVVDRALIERTLGGFALTSAARKELTDAVAVVLATYPIDMKLLLETLEEKDIVDDEAEVTARLLIAQLTEMTEGAQHDLIGAVTGIGASDRLYSTVELYSYTDGVMNIRLVTGVALSDADTTIAASATNSTQLSKDFRARTADVLTAIQDGGAFAGQVNLDLRSRSPGAQRGSWWTLSGTAGKLGGLTEKGRLSFGALTELSFFSWTEKSRYDASPKGIIVTFRGGMRYASEGIITGDATRKQLWFGQAMFEGRPEQTGVPLGFTLTWVEGAYKPYVVGLQVFGIVGM